jgi:uncharacterized membrane protein
MFPPIPTWQGLHPLIIHFPIALLFVAPMLVLVAMTMRKSGRVMNAAALVVMAIGTAASYLALTTGDAAGEAVSKGGAVAGVLERHEELAQTASVVFSILTGLFAIILVGPILVRKAISYRTSVVVSAVYLILYTTGLGVLAAAAHQGGRLVHEFGVHGQLNSQHRLTVAGDAD